MNVDTGRQPEEQLDKNARNVSTSKLVTRQAVEEWLGGYYVVDHSRCGLPNLPNTLGDTFGFINNAVSWQKRDFVYADDNVWGDDFRSGSDYYSSSTTSGFDGVEAVVIGYIATHGGTSATRSPWPWAATPPTAAVR